MSERQYMEALNKEIQKLNGVIDWKIMHSANYKKEAKRHRVLLSQIRKEEARRRVKGIFRLFFPAFR